jgi:hypothetical protein
LPLVKVQCRAAMVSALKINGRMLYTTCQLQPYGLVAPSRLA